MDEQEREVTGEDSPEVPEAPAPVVEKGDGDRRCVWLFSELIHGLDAMVHLSKTGTMPSLVPFMALIRDVAEVAQTRGTALQHLFLSRQDRHGDEPSHLHACRTLIGVGLAQYLGLNRVSVMSIGLVTILDRVTAGTKPEQVLQLHSRFPTLDELGPGVMMGIHGLECARRDEEAGTMPKLVRLVEDFVAQIQDEDPVGVVAVREALKQGGHEPRLIELLFAWLGDPPVGTTFEHPEHGPSLIFDRGGPSKGLRIRPVYYGAMGELIEMGQLPSGVDLSFGGEREYEFEF